MTIIQQSSSSVSFDPHAVARRRQRMRLKRHFIQWAILAAIAALIIAFVLAVKNGLGRHGIVFSFSYLWQSSGFDISEEKPLPLMAAGGQRLPVSMPRIVAHRPSLPDFITPSKWPLLRS